MRLFSLRTPLGALLSIFLSLPAFSFTPSIGTIQPRGGQRGTEMTIRLSGDRLYEPQEILLYQPGITVTKLEKVGDQHKAVKATISIAPDAPLGEHMMRLRCKGGISYQRSFWVGEYPTVMEKRSEDGSRDLNSNFNEPQEIQINQTVQGVADREDADYYLLQCRKGQRLSVEVEGMRLGRLLFDPYVAILNSKRFEQAAADDTPLLLQDCFASIVVPEDGTYWVEVRDSSYAGNANSRYRLHIGNFPRPQVVFPAGGKAGTELEVSFLGDKAGLPKKKIQLPAKADPAFALLAEADGQRSPSANRFRVSDFADVLEVEPNENRTKVPVPEVTPPMAFHGDQRTEIEFTRFQGFAPSTMGTMGKS